MRFQFNTSRLYTNEGQVIVVEYDPGTGGVHFNDVSRMISKAFTIEPGLTHVRDVAEQVMISYDRGRGENTMWSEAPTRDSNEVIHLLRF